MTNEDYSKMSFKGVGIIALTLFLSVILVTLIIAYGTLIHIPRGLELTLSYIYLILVTFVLMVRFPLAFAYDTKKYSFVEGYEPIVTVIVPAYNEEKVIKDTILSVLDIDYPKDKLEVVAVNDGSKDGTANAIRELNQTHEFKFVDFKENRGKRHALYLGFKEAKGDIIVVMDSDTCLNKDFIREIIKPFADPRIGGVCGHTDVIEENWVASMQNANYFTSFHLYKKCESLFNSVTCLSGCGSAYRKSAIMPIIDEWVNQTFLGVRCTYGEDRGLTTLMLRDGWDAIYVPTARTKTYAPTTLGKLIKQRLRWKKSFIREMIWQSKFAYRREKGFGIVYYTYVISNILAPFIVMANFFILPILFGWISIPIYLLGLGLSTAIYATYSKIYNEKFSVFYLFVWTTFNLLVLQVLSIYAWLTMTDTSWGTR